MNRIRAIQRVGRLAPPRLKAFRARLLLDRYAEQMGMEEVVCPACEGSGRLDGCVADRCPICRGFAEVPESLALWFSEAMAAVRAVPCRCWASALRSLTPPACVRYGRCGETLARLSPEAGHDWSAFLVEDSRESLAP